MWKILLAAVLFYAFIPGVLVTLPPKGSRLSVHLVHAALFAVVLHYAMKYVRYDYFGNHGPMGCPPTHYAGTTHAGVEACLPKPGTRQNPPGLEKKD